MKVNFAGNTVTVLAPYGATGSLGNSGAHPSHRTSSQPRRRREDLMPGSNGETIGRNTHCSRFCNITPQAKTIQTPWLIIRKRTIPTKRPPLVGEVSTNFVGRGVLRGQRNGSPRPLIRFPRPGPPLFLPSSSSVILQRLRGAPFQTHCFSENLVAPEIEPETSETVSRNSDH
jgi:hypothetical protein